MVFRRKPAILAVLLEEIEMCGAITVDTLVNVARSAVHRIQICVDANGEHFEHYQ
jgi:hypothetical protein